MVRTSSRAIHGFSFAAEGLIHAALPERPWRPLLSNAGYTLGFLIVVLGRQQLFTEATLTAVLPFLAQPNRSTFLRMLRLWGTVFAANLVGALLFAWIISATSVFPTAVQHALSEIGHQALDGDVGTIFVRGTCAGWPIGLMVWLLPGAGSNNVAIIIILTYTVGLAGLAHSIAGSVEVFYLVLRGTTAWGTYLAAFLLPAVVGNIIGGVSFVAALNHAQVVSQATEQ